MVPGNWANKIHFKSQGSKIGIEKKPGVCMLEYEEEYAGNNNVVEFTMKILKEDRCQASFELE